MQEACAVALVGESQATSVEDLQSKLEKELSLQAQNSSLLDFDILLPTNDAISEEVNVPIVILYGVPGEESFKHLHQQLTKAAQQGMLLFKGKSCGYPSQHLSMNLLY